LENTNNLENANDLESTDNFCPTTKEREGLSQPATKGTRGVVPAREDEAREGLSQPATKGARGVVPAREEAREG
jgi:hypothetical protein